jgi:hypothetical protein
MIKTKLTALFTLALILLSSLSIPVYSSGTVVGEMAEILDYSGDDALAKMAEVGMLLGSGGGITHAYGQESASRLQAAIMLLRLMNKETVAINYTTGTTYTDGISAIGWAGGRNVVSYVKDNPEVGFSGYPDGSFNPNGGITGQMYYKLILHALGYEYGTDYVWSGGNNDVLAKSISIGLTKGAELYSKELKVVDFSEMTCQALQLMMKDGTKTLGEHLGKEITKTTNTDTNTNTGTLTYDLSAYTNSVEAEKLYKKTNATDLMRGAYRMPIADNDFYDNFWDGWSLDKKMIAMKAFLTQKGYFNGEINSEFNYTNSIYDRNIKKDEFMEAFLAFQNDHTGENTPIVYKNIGYQPALYMAGEQQLMFDMKIEDKFYREFAAWTYDVDPAVSKMNVNLLENEYRLKTGNQTTNPKKYVIYADIASNTYYLTEGLEIVSQNVISLDGANTISSGKFEGLSSAIVSQATINVYSSNLTLSVVD